MTATRRSSRRRRRRGRGGLYVALAAALLLAGLWAAYTLLPLPDGDPAPAPDPAAATDAGGALGATTAHLFYIDESGTALVSRPVELPEAPTPQVRARHIVERLLEPPEPPLLSPFPDGTLLRTIYLTGGGDAFADLSRHATEGQSGGSLDELFTVYALVNALTLNVEAIDAVQILIEGREVDTLSGHVDLRRPLALNLSWVAPGDAAVELAAGREGP